MKLKYHYIMNFKFVTSCHTFKGSILIDSVSRTLYKEFLSLKHEQVKWNASKKNLTNEIDVLKGEKKSFLDNCFP